MRYDLTPRADRIRALRAQIRRLEDEVTVLIKADMVPDRVDAPECGTERGYQRHSKRGEVADKACRTAHAIHERHRAAARRQHKLGKAS